MAVSSIAAVSRRAAVPPSPLHSSAPSWSRPLGALTYTTLLESALWTVCDGGTCFGVSSTAVLLSPAAVAPSPTLPPDVLPFSRSGGLSQLPYSVQRPLDSA